MRIIRFMQHLQIYLAVVTDQEEAYRLPDSDFLSLVGRAHRQAMQPGEMLRRELPKLDRIKDPWTELTLLTPIEAPEVWAAGVTYERSREARNFEVSGGRPTAGTFYDKVYDAERPELFFKSTAARTVGPRGEVCIRNDSHWQVPEPELGLVLDKSGAILGYTAGNDMSCRDIEGENPLYLPQAKVWRNSCAIGPTIRLADTVDDPYAFTMICRIYREGRKVVEGTASTGQLKRRLDELVSYLIRDNQVFDGTVLLTGTCIVPPDDFTLQAGDRIEIEIAGIGTLVNDVALA